MLLQTVPTRPQLHTRRPQPPAAFGRTAGRAERRSTSEPVIHHVAPPYQRERRIFSGAAVPLPPGSVLLVDAVPLPTDWEAFAVTARELRSRYPGASLVLRVDPSFEDLLELTARGVPSCVRGVLLRGRPIAQPLRHQLTNRSGLPDGIVDWLTARGVRMSPALADLVRQIFARAPRHSEISALCRASGAVESSARFRFSKKGLPSPSRWLQAARGIHAILGLQAEPHRSLLSAALELGYSDHSALSHQIRRTFGVRPGEIRDQLGWEWLMDRWLEKARVARPPPPRGPVTDLPSSRPSDPRLPDPAWLP